MLFYFKSSELWSEPAGVIVLDIGSIRVDPVPLDGVWPFTLGTKNNINLLKDKNVIFPH